MPNLLDIELDLLAALDRLNEIEGEEIPEDTQALVCGYLDAAEAKRDSMARFLDSLESRADAINAEANRLREKAELVERSRDRLASFVVSVMRRTGTLRLEGATRVLAIQQNPASVVVDGDVPAEYLLPQKPAPVPGPDKRKIKAALEAGVPVLNSRIVEGAWRLVVK